MAGLAVQQFALTRAGPGPLREVTATMMSSLRPPIVEHRLRESEDIAAKLAPMLAFSLRALGAGPRGDGRQCPRRCASEISVEGAYGKRMEFVWRFPAASAGSA